MKNNSYNRVAVFTLLAVAMALVVALWPVTGRSQTSGRRDRVRRDVSTRSSSVRTEQAPRQVSERKGPATKPVEPNAAQAKPDGAAQPTGANEAAAPRPDEVGPSTESPGGEGAGAWARYSIILQRNIFSRQRTPFRPKERNSEPPVVVPNPETHFLLKGVVQEDNEFIAFVEDTQGGEVLRLRQGDRVARGAIKTLNLDAIEYELEGKTIVVKLGYDLEGGRGSVMARDLLEALPASSPAAAGQQAQPPVPSGDEAEILRRLMEQRKQQLGQ